MQPLTEILNSLGSWSAILVLIIAIPTGLFGAVKWVLKARVEFFEIQRKTEEARAKLSARRERIRQEPFNKSQSGKRDTSIASALVDTNFEILERYYEQ